MPKGGGVYHVRHRGKKCSKGGFHICVALAGTENIASKCLQLVRRRVSEWEYLRVNIPPNSLMPLSPQHSQSNVFQDRGSQPKTSISIPASVDYVIGTKSVRPAKKQYRVLQYVQ